MAGEAPVSRLLPLLREFGALEKKRGDQGVTPLEYQRWLDLRNTLEKHYPQGHAPKQGERRRHVRIPTRMLVQFRTRDELKDAIISNVSHGGLFIHTPFAPEIGTSFQLLIRLGDTGGAVDVPCEVVSINVSDGFTTGTLGMGVKFGELDSAQSAAISVLFSEALGHAFEAAGALEEGDGE